MGSEVVGSEAVREGKGWHKTFGFVRQWPDDVPVRIGEEERDDNEVEEEQEKEVEDGNGEKGGMEEWRGQQRESNDEGIQDAETMKKHFTTSKSTRGECKGRWRATRLYKRRWKKRGGLKRGVEETGIGRATSEESYERRRLKSIRRY